MNSVELKGGLIVSVEAIQLAIDLENAGVALQAKSGVLVASPASVLTPAQIAAIRAMKFQLLAIAGYDADAN